MYVQSVERLIATLEVCTTHGHISIFRWMPNSFEYRPKMRWLSPLRRLAHWEVVTIMYMGPGGHRQRPTSISALLDRLSWLVLQTRSLALKSFQSAVQKKPGWCPRYYKGTKIAKAPPPPIKCLDIGTKMGFYEIREHISGTDDKSNIFHPRFEGDGIPASDTFHSVIHERLEKSHSDIEAWCTPSAWFNHSPQCDFRVKNAYGYIWGLPVIVPRSSLRWVPERSMLTLSLTHCTLHHLT